MVFHDFTGQVFGQWTVLKRVVTNPQNHQSRWLCRCTCGSEYEVVGINLTSGRSRKCVKCANVLPADLVGQRFNHWTVIERAENRRDGSTRWLCKCDCGEDEIILGTNLRSNKSKQCRKCNGRNSAVRNFTTHGHGGHGIKRSRTYTTWTKMKSRCLNPKNNRYSYYGGRGITVCARWLTSFDDFLADMGERPVGMTIDRIDPDGNYEPGNCRWATQSEQEKNKVK